MRCLVLALLLISTTANAQLNFEWSDYTDTADGFRLYQDSSSNMISDSIPISATTVSAPDPTDNECHNYWIRAFRNGVESGNSAIATWCPADVDPPVITRPVNVGGFNISIQVTPN